MISLDSCSVASSWGSCGIVTPTMEISTFLVVSLLVFLITYIIKTPLRRLLTIQPTINPASALLSRWERYCRVSVDGLVVFFVIRIVWSDLSSKIAFIAGDVQEEGYLLLLKTYQYSIRIDLKPSKRLKICSPAIIILLDRVWRLVRICSRLIWVLELHRRSEHPIELGRDYMEESSQYHVEFEEYFQFISGFLISTWMKLRSFRNHKSIG